MFVSKLRMCIIGGGGGKGRNPPKAPKSGHPGHRSCSRSLSTQNHVTQCELRFKDSCPHASMHACLLFGALHGKTVGIDLID